MQSVNTSCCSDSDSQLLVHCSSVNQKNPSVRAFRHALSCLYGCRAFLTDPLTHRRTLNLAIFQVCTMSQWKICIITTTDTWCISVMPLPLLYLSLSLIKLSLSLSLSPSCDMSQCVTATRAPQGAFTRTRPRGSMNWLSLSGCCSCPA